MNEIPALRAALVAAADRERRLAAAPEEGPARTTFGRRAGGRRVWLLQLRLVALAGAAVLLIAAAALAATGVFSPGRPLAPVSAPNPRTADGAVIPSTIRLLALRTADPGGGPDWGLRLVRTTRGEVCLAPGRVQHGVIGVLGRDGAFGDDGRLHPFARDYIGPINCALPDARGHAFSSIGFVGLPSSALGPGTAVPAAGCRVDNPPPANRALLCRTRALRDVYYGLLGPDAVSVAYRGRSGRLATQRTVGPDGAYLIVLPYRGGLQGTAGIGVGLSGPPFVSVRYRGGHACTTAGGHTCQPVGYRASRITRVTAAEVRAPVSARVVRARVYCSAPHNGPLVTCDGHVPPGFSRIGGAPGLLVDISFTARVPVTSSHAYYEVDARYARSRGCTIGATVGPTSADIRAGQRIHTQDFVPLSCPGLVHGVVRYVQSSPLAPPFSSLPDITAVTVGRFVVLPTRRPSR